MQAFNCVKKTLFSEIINKNHNTHNDSCGCMKKKKSPIPNNIWAVRLCVSSQKTVYCISLYHLLMWTSRGGRSLREGRRVSILSNPVSPFPKGSHVHSTAYSRAGYNRTTGLFRCRGSPESSVVYLRWWTSTHGPAIIHCMGLENAWPSWQPINTRMSEALASTCTHCPQNDC